MTDQTVDVYCVRRAMRCFGHTLR